MLSDCEYSRRVRLAGVVVVIVLILVVGAGVVVVRVRDLRQARAALSSVMVEEFEGDRPGAVPLGEAPGSFVPGVSDPDVWPVDPIPSSRVSGIRKAISVYNSLFPGDTVSFESVKRAYGRDLKRNVEQGWKLDKKEHAFIHWSRHYANLVYKNDIFSDGRLIHHKGDKAIDVDGITNYYFITHSDSHAFQDYMFAPGQGE
ncbi:hypothetical protein HMPREF9156_00571 [Scardovia wiggsiae F0424]|uniref:Uncharacterized protein n=1 Tax=Scardovia wiggsiae F0424 TaxID=857290 RepID=J0LMT2_9BIFI|nr:hypothetical protein [Scardovia wiggsiae]EJD65127.1 hypothetical protein HMPREF9156_00571 [Scardovia wiggsiae F0424]